MPKKPNSSGAMQNYVPKGNGDASGEYADDGGYNIHYFEHFEKEVQGQVVNTPKIEEIKSKIDDLIYQEGKDLDDVLDLLNENNVDEDAKLELTDYYLDKKEEKSILEDDELLEEDLDWVDEDEKKDNKGFEEFNKEETKETSQVDDLKAKIDEIIKNGDNPYNVELLLKENKVDDTLFVDMLSYYYKSKYYYDLSNKENAKKEEEPKEDLTLEMDNVEEVKKEQQKITKKLIKSYDDTECYDYLLTKNKGEFDEEKVKNLSSKELKELVLAQYEDSTGKLQKKIDKSYQQLEDFVNSDESGLKNIWKEFPDTPEKLKISLEKKKDWFENSLLNWQLDEAYKPDFQKKYDNLNNFDNICKDYLDKWEKYYNEKQKNDDILSKYINPDNVYSQKAKDNAYWFQNKYESDAFLKPIAEKTIAKIKSANPDAYDMLKHYTEAYSYINEPLRKKKYDSYKGAGLKGFVKDVENMTYAIDQSVSQHNMWLQRAVSELNINGNTLNYYTNTNDLQSLVGTTFEDNGFVSCGSAKGTGFHDKITMNIYAPKGTKMLYVDPISHYSGTNENETIIQRGYSYKITKVEKTKGQIYLDCEVVLGSDVKKYNSQQLAELQQKYM